MTTPFLAFFLVDTRGFNYTCSPPVPQHSVPSRGPISGVLTPPVICVVYILLNFQFPKVVENF